MNASLKPIRVGRGRIISALAVAAFALLLGGCFTDVNTVHPQAALPKAPKQSHEAARVEREHQRILATYNGVYRDPRLSTMVSQTVAKLVAASERPDQHYNVTVLNSAAINAFALPSGNLYVTRGLIELANDRSELASVLSHEMAHVIAQHAAMREDRARQAALVTRVFDNFGADPQMSALALAKSKIALASFSREQEFEADGIGIGIATRAGFDPYGAVRFLSAMGRQAALRSHAPSLPDFLSSHPSTPERVRRAKINARQFSGPGNGKRDRDAYLNVVDGMIYGEDPSTGIVRGRRFLHPKLGFTFLAPEGFALDNTPQAVLGVMDGGGEALRLDVVQVRAAQSLPDYLKSGWIENIDASSVRALTLNGHAAATATASSDKWTFRLYALRFGSDVYRFIFAAKHLSPAIDRAFHDTVASFRRMTPAELIATRPLRIHIVAVRQGDTIEQLASDMATDRKLERFRILNELGPTDELRPGERVKLVMQ